MTEKKLLCQLCGRRVANTPNVLARHVRAEHGTEWADYVVRFEHGGQWPTCACGCGEQLLWKKGGFGKYAKGHDNRGAQNSQAHDAPLGPGWVANPFTGREEHITSDDEVAFLDHCRERNDPVTHDHGIRVGWDDAGGKLRIAVPSFRHLQRRLLITVEAQGDPDTDRRVAGYKAWCDEHRYMLLVVRRDPEGFVVTGAHRPKEMTDAEETQQGKVPIGPRQEAGGGEVRSQPVKR